MSQKPSGTSDPQFAGFRIKPASNSRGENANGNRGDAIKISPLEEGEPAHCADTEEQRSRFLAPARGCSAKFRRQGGSALGKACGCVGGLKIPPFAKAAKDGAPAKDGQKVMAQFVSGIVWLAADERPSLDATPVAGLPVRVLRFKRKARLDYEMHRGFILKANGNGVVFAGAKEFNIVQRLALCFFKAMEVTAFVTANGGLTAPGDDGFGQPRNALPFAGFARGLRASGRAFTFNGSHIASYGAIWLGRRSVFTAPALPVKVR
jgi:hypothetical protein